MDGITDTLSDLYYPSETADLDFDLLHDLNYDFNLLGDDEETNSSTAIKQEHSPASSSSEFSDRSPFDPFNPGDSPPLTPPCSDPVNSQINIENESNNNCLLATGTSMLDPKFPKILPALKSSRGRSASHDSPDIQALKRHIRMIRNRESASLSRKKKKEYLSCLEIRVKELEMENAKLKHENCALKSKLGQIMGSSAVGAAKNLAAVLTSTGKNNTLPSVTAKVALLGLVCFVFVSFHKPTLLATNSNSTSHVMSSIPARPMAIDHEVRDIPLFDSPGARAFRARRSLLWEERVTNDIHWNDRNNSTSENNTQDYLLDSPDNKNPDFMNETLVSTRPSKCPTAFNQTEAMRVQNHLKGIFSPKPKKKVPAKPIVYSWIDVNSNDNKGLALYDDKMRRFTKVLDQMHRRPDTFYVVSLTAENQLLLSAKSLNATSRPKMSFLMPWRNDTLGGKEELMQIDCEVTQVFSLNRNKRKRA